MSWKNILYSTVLTAAVTVMQADACFDPLSVYSVGIVFSRGETLATEKIEQYGDSSVSYLKTCERGNANAGQDYLTGSIEGMPVDPVTIDSAWVDMNTLYLNVSFSGGCEVHTFDLFTDGVVTDDTPPIAKFYLSHDANGDNCEAMVNDQLVFNLDGFAETTGIELKIYPPGVSEPYRPLPIWNQAYITAAPCSYKMRSAYSEKTMAYIGPYIGYSSEASSTFDQLLIIFDSTGTVPTAEVKVAALKAEIERLTRMGVLSFTAPQMASIEAQLSAIDAGQYWTAEDTVLQFNQWFGADGVNGVRGVYGVKGGCGAGVDYELPMGSIGPVGIAPARRSDGMIPVGMKVRGAGSAMTVSFAPVGRASRLVLTDMMGRTLRSVALSKGSTTLSLGSGVMTSISRGCYFVSLVTDGQVMQAVPFAVLH